MSALQHVFLTRFNLPSRGNERYVRAREGWLQNRVALFDRYCLPSMAEQTSRGFSWIIYFDPQSPAWLMNWIAQRAAGGLFRPVFRAEVPLAGRLEDIAAMRQGNPRLLLTTNLDNDDGLATDFVERLQAVASLPERTAIYLANGIIRTPEAAYLRRDRRNAFCSVVEPIEGAVTCWADAHNRLGQSMAERALGGPPAWLQVIHDTNVSNRARGRLVSPRSYGALFGTLLDDLPEPSRADYLAEYLVRIPRRSLREASRAAVKSLAYGLGGPEAADRVKEAWTRLRYGGGSRN